MKQREMPHEQLNASGIVSIRQIRAGFEQIFSIHFRVQIYQLLVENETERKMLLKKFEAFYAQNKVQWKIAHETSSKRLLPTAPQGVLEPPVEM